MAITTIAVLTEDLSIAASSDSEDGDILDLADDGGWEDLEPDVEKVEICCLRCSSVFPDVRLMLHHCKHQHSLDVVNVQKTLSSYQK